MTQIILYGLNTIRYIYNSSVNKNQEGEFTIVPQDTYTKEANFKGPEISKNTGWNSQNVYYSMYPSNGSGMIKKNTSGLFGTTTSYVISGSIPAVQEAVNGSYDQKLHYMTARSTTTNLSFKNVCALLKVEIKNNDNSNFKVSRIKVVANLKMSQTRGGGLFGSFQELNAPQYSTVNIAGDFSSSINNDGTATTVFSDNGIKSTYVELRGKETTVNGQKVLSPLSDGVYYLVVLPSAIDKGFTLLLEDVEGNKAYQRVSTKIQSFERNKMYNLGSYDISTLTPLENVVDLGLPSGTLWCLEDVASGNFGDISETEGFFAWGECQSKNIGNYDWDYAVGNGAFQHYTFGRGSTYATTVFTNPSTGGNGTLAKYYDQYRGNWGSWNLFDATYDNRFELEATDDVVTQRNGDSFCMPTQYQATELKDNTYVVYSNGRYTISGKGDYSSMKIIFNEGGYIDSKKYAFEATTTARFWTNTRGEDANSHKAHAIKIVDNSMSIETVERVEGRKAHGVVKR